MTHTKNHDRCPMGHCTCRYDYQKKGRKKTEYQKLMKFDIEFFIFSF